MEFSDFLSALLLCAWQSTFPVDSCFESDGRSNFEQVCEKLWLMVKYKGVGRYPRSFKT